MFTNTKYITYKCGSIELGIAFDCYENHACIKEAMKINKEDIIGAGFFDIGYDKEKETPVVNAYGRSTTLNIESSPLDKAILEKTLNINQP